MHHDACLFIVKLLTFEGKRLFFETESCYGVQAGLKLLIFPPQSSGAGVRYTLVAPALTHVLL